MAAFLEENELFVPEDEDDDDDDDDWKKTIKFFFEFSKFDCWKIINNSHIRYVIIVHNYDVLTYIMIKQFQHTKRKVIGII